MQVDTELRETYLFVVAQGHVGGIKEIKEHAVEGFRVASEKGLTKILVDGRQLSSNLSTTDRFEIGVFMSEEVRQRLMAGSTGISQVSLVFSKPTLESNRIVEMTASNRGLNLKITDDINEAFTWLGEKLPDEAA